MIFYNKPYITGREMILIEESVSNRHLSGNGVFTQNCQNFLQDKYHFKKCLLTTSCTDALEMCAILLNIQSGDEVIVPSFTFVSTANAFILCGAKIVLADSEDNNPNIDVDKIESLITPKTKAIVVVHYAGVACNMDAIMKLAEKHELFVVEDAAQAIDSYYKTTNTQKSLGSIGHLAAFSFHESKNIQCGEGGMLVINDERFIKRAEIIWEKGTNRAAFFRGEVDKYNWVDVGSSFLPSEITAAFLYAQLQQIDEIQDARKKIWHKYFEELKPLQQVKKISLPCVPEYATVNAHIFYIVCSSIKERDSLIVYLKENNVQSMFHYPGLHNSSYFTNKLRLSAEFINANKYANCLLRLPLFPQLSFFDVELICSLIKKYYNT